MMSRLIRVLCANVAVLAIACHSDSTGPDDGGSPLPPGIGLKLNPFITVGLSSPVFMTQPLDDGRIFVVEQGGRIRIVRNGVLLATPFLDISTRMLSGGERGLLSVAFHPQYTTNHFFYVYFTTQANGDIRIERFTTTSNPEVADPTTSKLIITAPHSTFDNHMDRRRVEAQRAAPRGETGAALPAAVHRDRIPRQWRRDPRAG